METFKSVLINRSPQWNLKILLVFIISILALLKICFARKTGRAKTCGMVMLWCYIYNVLVTTLLMRTPSEEIRYTLEVRFIRQVFEEHSEFAASEAFLNFLLLMPIGAFMPVLFKKRGFVKTAVFGFAFTLFIETTQLITHLGEFQTDDILLNTLGCWIGAAALYTADKLTAVYYKKKTVAPLPKCRKNNKFR